MFSPIVIIIIICIYFLFLFAVARWSEQTQIGRHWANHPIVYSLGLAVYCTTWTYYGSVGAAAGGGMSFLPVYLGPTLALLFGGSLFRRVIDQAVSATTLRQAKLFMEAFMAFYKVHRPK